MIRNAEILPVSIRNVQYYKISGKYSYEGELIITDGVLYFFPFLDLEERRLRKNMFFGGGCIFGGCLFGPIASPFTLVLAAIVSLPGSVVKPFHLSSSHSKLRALALWSDRDSTKS